MIIRHSRRVGLAIATVAMAFVVLILSTRRETSLEPAEALAPVQQASAAASRVPLAVDRTSQAVPVTSDDVPTAPNVIPGEATRVTLDGVVIDERNRPLEGVAIEISRRTVVETLATTATDHRGRFEISGLPAGEDLALHARAAQFRAFQVEVSAQRPGDHRTQTVVLRRGAVVRGLIIDASQQPVMHAAVGGTDPGVETTLSGADGRFELRGFGDDLTKVFVHAAGYATKVVHHVKPGTTDVIVALERAAIVTGKTRVPSTVDHVLVSACHLDEQFHKEICVARQVVRPPSDRYRLEGLASGQYDLVVEAQGYPLRREVVLVKPGQEFAGPDLIVSGTQGS